MSELARPGAQLVYANWGRWMAMCPCQVAVHFGAPGHPPLLAGGWRCDNCGDKNEAIWPHPEMMYGIVRLLSQRRHVHNQNWLPGEQLSDLVWENSQHGVGADAATKEHPDGGMLILAAGDRILQDRLPLPPSGHRYLELEMR